MKKINSIKNKSFSEERALYNSNNLYLYNIKFTGKEDGESALKESSNLLLNNCYFNLRYPLWHTRNVKISDTKFTLNCRGAFWYDKNIQLVNCNSDGPKIFRECKKIKLYDSNINGVEPFWRCNNIYVINSLINGEYAFFESNNIILENIKFSGKYSFQYVKTLKLYNCELDTKDAFWHAENVYCENCKIKGEYIGWYSNNLTFKNCIIESHQPFCYMRGLKLIDCKMPNSDLAFEYSEVNGNILGKINSIKNPLKGKLFVNKVGKIVEENKKYKSKAKIIIK